MQEVRTHGTEHLLLSPNSLILLPTDNTPRALNFVPKGSLFFCLNMHLLADSLEFKHLIPFPAKNHPFLLNSGLSDCQSNQLVLSLFQETPATFSHEREYFQLKTYRNIMIVGRSDRGRELIMRRKENG